jgi:hypothetical protein
MILIAVKMGSGVLAMNENLVKLFNSIKDVYLSDLSDDGDFDRDEFNKSMSKIYTDLTMCMAIFHTSLSDRDVDEYFIEHSSKALDAALTIMRHAPTQPEFTVH